MFDALTSCVAAGRVPVHTGPTHGAPPSCLQQAPLQGCGHLQAGAPLAGEELLRGQARHAGDRRWHQVSDGGAQQLQRSGGARGYTRGQRPVSVRGAMRAASLGGRVLTPILSRRFVFVTSISMPEDLKRFGVPIAGLGFIARHASKLRRVRSACPRRATCWWCEGVV